MAKIKCHEIQSVSYKSYIRCNIFFFIVCTITKYKFGRPVTNGNL